MVLAILGAIMIISNFVMNARAGKSGSDGERTDKITNIDWFEKFNFNYFYHIYRL